MKALTAFMTVLSQCLLVRHKANPLTSEHLPYVVYSFSSLFLGEINVYSVFWLTLVRIFIICMLKKMEPMHQEQQMVIAF